MIFNLTASKKFKILEPECAIYCFKSFGPVFSNTLGIFDEPFDEKDKCDSINECFTYESRIEDGFNMLLQIPVEESNPN